MKALTEFIDYLKVNKRYSPRTLSLYTGYINDFYNFISLSEDEDEFSQLQPNIIRGFIASGLDSGLSPRTMNLKLSSLSSYSNFLVKKGVYKIKSCKKGSSSQTIKKPSRVLHSGSH